jgi:chromosome partitioning protein
MARVLAIVNQKGGVGKTTTAVNLSAGLAAGGRRTLLVDCDPQSNATRSLGFTDDRERTLYDAIVPDDATPLCDIIVPTRVPAMDLVPASPGLAGAEVELVAVAGRERRLLRALQPATGRYAFIVIDCPPSLGLLSVNALAAADGVIVPVQCEYLALEGLGLLMRTLDLVRSRINPRLQLTGLVMTMFDSRTNLAGQVVDEVSRHFPDLCFDSVIPRSVRVSEAPSYGETVLQYAPTNPGADAYRALALELVRRCDGQDSQQ